MPMFLKQIANHAMVFYLIENAFLKPWHNLWKLPYETILNQTTFINLIYL
jgi:hypothetical protein